MTEPLVNEIEIEWPFPETLKTGMKFIQNIHGSEVPCEVILKEPGKVILRAQLRTIIVTGDNVMHCIGKIQCDATRLMDLAIPIGEVMGSMEIKEVKGK